MFQTQTTSEVQGQERIPGEVKQEVPSGAETNLDPMRMNQESISLKPEYSSSGDIKVDMSGHEQYISKIKERLMRRMHPDVSCDSGQDKVRHEGKGSGSSSPLKHLKRKYTRSGPGKYTAPLMKKAAQAMKREHVPYHHSSQQQQQSSPHAQAHGKPVLSKTVLDLSDITGESVDEGEHCSRIRSSHKRLGHTQLKGSQAVSKRLGIQKLKEVRLPKQQKNRDQGERREEGGGRGVWWRDGGREQRGFPGINLIFFVRYEQLAQISVIIQRVASCVRIILFSIYPDSIFYFHSYEQKLFFLSLYFAPLLQFKRVCRCALTITVVIP